MIEFTWIDISIVVIFLLSTLIGIYRGLMRELITILTWLIAFVLAIVHGKAAGELFTFISSDPVKKVLGMVTVFVSVVILGIIIKFFVLRSFNIGKPSGLGRFLGAGFGVVRAGAIVVLTLAFATSSQIEDLSAFKDSQLIPQFKSIVDFLNIKMPQKWHRNNNSADSGLIDAATDAGTIENEIIQETENPASDSGNNAQ